MFNASYLISDYQNKICLSPKSPGPPFFAKIWLRDEEDWAPTYFFQCQGEPTSNSLIWSKKLRLSDVTIPRKMNFSFHILELKNVGLNHLMYNIQSKIDLSFFIRFDEKSYPSSMIFIMQKFSPFCWKLLKRQLGKKNLDLKSHFEQFLLCLQSTVGWKFIVLELGERK